MKTRDWHLRLIDDLDNLPDSFKRKVIELNMMGNGNQIIFLPSQLYPFQRKFLFLNMSFGWRITPPRTMIINNEIIIILEETNEGMIEIRIPIGSIIDQEIGLNLLYAYIQIKWIEERMVKSIFIEFNAVGEYIMRQWLDNVRKRVSTPIGIYCSESGKKSSEDSKSTPIKFENYLQYSLLEGERLFFDIFQPAASKMKIWPYIYLSPNSLLAISDRNIIILKEDTSISSTYSILTHYIPLTSVKGIEFETKTEAINMRIVYGTEQTNTEELFRLSEMGAMKIRKILESGRIPIQEHSGLN